MIDWGTLKGFVTDSILNDPAQAKFTDFQLMTWARFACVQISYHTAETAYKEILCDGAQYRFPLPDDAIESIEKAGLVGLNDGTETKFLTALRRQPGQRWPTTLPALDNLKSRGYWEWPAGVLTLDFIPKANHKLCLYYFKSWDAPTGDTSILHFPRWMEEPFCYLLSAAAMNPKAFTASDIRQWNRKQDSGTPDMNPLIKQAEFYWKQADRLLQKMTPQDRESFYGNKDTAWTHQ